MSRSGPGRITSRILFASFPVWSLGVLTWVPSLRIAVQRRRPVDWLVCGVFMVLTVAYVMLLSTFPDEGEISDAQGVMFVVALMALWGGGVTHAFVGDSYPRPGDGKPPVGYPHPGPMGAHRPPAPGYGYPAYQQHHPQPAHFHQPQPQPQPVQQPQHHQPQPPAGYPPPPGGGPAPAPGYPHQPAAPETPPPTQGPGVPAPAGPPPGGSSPRIQQAVDELDELGDLLRGREPER